MDGRSAGIIPIKTSHDSSNDTSILGNIAAMNFDGGASNSTNRDKLSHPSSLNSWWSSRDPLESLDQAASELLPPRHYWNSHVLQFSDNDKVQIFEQLGIYLSPRTYTNPLCLLFLMHI